MVPNKEYSYDYPSMQILNFTKISRGGFPQNEINQICFCNLLSQCHFILSYCTANRLRDFQIGVSNFNPGSVDPNLYRSSDYKTCAKYRPAMGPGEYRSFDCFDQGRYVIVQLSAHDYLTLCEVEVFGHGRYLEHMI